MSPAQILQHLRRCRAEPSLDLSGALHIGKPDLVSVELIAAAQLHQAAIVKLLQAEDGVTRSQR